MNKILKILQNYFFLQPSGTREALLERPKGSWNSRRLLERALSLLERRIAVTRVRVCDGNAMNVRWTCDASPLGSPESYARMGRAEALVARRFSGAVSAMRLKCRMRVQNYCFFLTWQWVVRDVVRSVSADLYDAPQALPVPASAPFRRHSHPRKRSLSAGPSFLWLFSPYATILRGFL